MKIAAWVCWLVMLATPASADTYDIATYTPPATWTREDTGTGRHFTIVDKQAGTFVGIAVRVDARDMGNDLADAWKAIVEKQFPTIGAPTTTPAASDGAGWKVEMAAAQFTLQQRTAAAILVVMTRDALRFEIGYVATADCMAQLDPMIKSLSLDASRSKIKTTTQPTTTTTTADGPVAALADYVELRQGKVTVRLHYAHPIPDGYRETTKKRDYYWSTQVEPRFSQFTNVEKPRPEPYSTEWMATDAVERATNQRVHVAIYSFTANGVVSTVELVAPSKAILHAAYPDADKIGALSDLNRFPVSAGEVAGTWSDAGSSFVQYYNVYTGDSAGMGVASSAYKIAFAAKGTFASEIKAVSGKAGALKFAQENRAGAWKLPDAWTLTTVTKERTKAYWVWFEAVRGGKLLHVNDKQYSSMHDVLSRQK